MDLRKKERERERKKEIRQAEELRARTKVWDREVYAFTRFTFTTHGKERRKKRAYRGGSRFPRRLRAGAYAPSRTGSRDRDRDLGTLLERRPYSC